MKQTLASTLIIICFLSFAQEPTPEQIRQVQDAKKEVKRMKGEYFPAFELRAIDGTLYKSEDLKGSVVLLNFWFTSCRPCVEELPAINDLVTEFENEDVVFIAPTFDDLPKVQKFLSRFEFNYEPVADVKDFVLANNVRSFPTHFVIDQEGRIEKVVIGYSALTDNMLRKAINKLVN